MPRFARHLTAALLWIAIAILPLRGMAASLMPAMALPSAPAAVASSDLPCHGAALDGAVAAELAAQPAAPVGDCPTCSLCAFCHASVVQASPLSLELPALPAAAPAVAPPSAIEPRAPDGLFRPPRSFLA